MSWIENPGVETFDGLNISDLHVDEAWLKVTTQAGSPLVWLYTLSANCNECSFERVWDDPIVPEVREQFKISTQYPLKYRIRTDGKDKFVSTEKYDSK